MTSTGTNSVLTIGKQDVRIRSLNQRQGNIINQFSRDVKTVDLFYLRYVQFPGLFFFVFHQLVEFTVFNDPGIGVQFRDITPADEAVVLATIGREGTVLRAPLGFAGR